MHYIKKCSCGKVLEQCRCPSKDKTEIFVKNGCEECKKKDLNLKTLTKLEFELKN